MMSRTLLSIGLLSLSLLAFQLAMMQVLSLMQWHHFASLVIALALLGFGASGTVLAMIRQRAMRHADALLPWSMIVSGVLMPVGVALAQVPPVRFDSLTVFAEPQGLVGLLLTALLVMLPFFLGATAIAIALSRWPERASLLYFGTMVGSGAGTIISLGLMWWLEPARLPALWGACGITAGMLLARSRAARLAAGAALALCILACILPPELVLSQFKAAAAALRLPGARITYRAPSPDGLLEVIYAPALRAAPGVSLTYGGEVPPSPVVYTNGDRVGPLLDPSDSAIREILRATTFALPYAIRSPRQVLILESGSGSLVAQALAQGVPSIVAVEPNERLASLTQTTFDSRISTSQHVRWDVLSPRTFLGRSDDLFDLIAVPPVGTYGGGAGLSALKEEYTLTVESLEMMWSHLTANGMVSLTAWMTYPPRAVPKLAATIASMASRTGIPLEDHLAAVRGWGTATFILSRSPLLQPAIDSVRTFCADYGFDPLLLRGLRPEERVTHHALHDTSLFVLLDALLEGDTGFAKRASPFRLTPAVDDRPYFHQFLRLDRLGTTGRLFGAGSLPYVEAGYAVVLITAALVIVMAILLVALPLLAGGTAGHGRIFGAIVFAGLGIGYMVAEISLIQRFVPLLGNTVSSAGIVIGSLLVSSGAGSLVSGRVSARPRSLAFSTAVVAGVLTLLFLALPLLVPLVLPLPGGARALASVLLVALPGVVMGVPFPLSLRLLASGEAANVPWVWGINGACSVVGASIAPIIAVEFGLSAVLVVAAGAYTVVALAGAVLGLKGRRRT